MTRLLSLVVLASLLTPSAALAASPPTLLLHPSTGEKGIWLDLETSRKALEALETRPKLLERLELADQELELRTQALEETKALHLEAEASAARLADALARESRERSETQLELLEARGDRWTWGAVGAGGGAVVALILALVLQ